MRSNRWSVSLTLKAWTPIIVVLLLRIPACFGLIPATIQMINVPQPSAGGNQQSAEKDATGVNSVENFYFEHMISEKDAATAFRTMADELINSECSRALLDYFLLRAFGC